MKTQNPPSLQLPLVHPAPIGLPFVLREVFFMEEIWKTITEYPNYEISNFGVVKSKQRKVNRFNGRIFHDKTINERFLKQSLCGSGYGFVTLRKNNRPYNRKIHILVAKYFIGNRPNGLVINHKDGNKLNNNILNLEYVSKQKNTQLYYNSIGKSSGKVPILDIIKIKTRVEKGEDCYKIAKEYNVSRNDIAVICKIISLTGEDLTC